MSFTFQIPFRSPPPRSLFDSLPLPDVAWVEPPENDFVLEGSYHLHIQQRSTRGVEITWEGGILEVRILVGSSPEDFALAQAIVTEAAHRAQSRIKPEDGPPITLQEFEKRFGLRWSNKMADWGARHLRGLVRQHGGQVMLLVGPSRPFDLGPRILKILDAAGPAETFPKRFFDQIRRVQYPPPGYAAPEATIVPLPGNREVSAVLWNLEQPTLFPPVKYIHLHALDGQPIFLPPEALFALPSVVATWADEHRLLVAAVPVFAWEKLWAHAQELSVYRTIHNTH